MIGTILMLTVQFHCAFLISMRKENDKNAIFLTLIINCSCIQYEIDFKFVSNLQTTYYLNSDKVLVQRCCESVRGQVE